MEAVACLLATVYFVGLMVAISVLRVRAGLGFWYGLKILGDNGVGAAWFATAAVSSMFWPMTLAAWLARGRPEPRVVFNEKAAARRRLI